MTTNPKGTIFVELVASLMDLLANPKVSRIEIVIGEYQLDENGKPKLENGKEAVTTRAIAISGMDAEVQEKLRAEIDQGPITLLMVLWMDPTREGAPFGMQFFNDVGKRRSPGIDGMDHLEKTVMADYLNRQVRAQKP